MDILDDSASCWSIGSLEQKITRLFSYDETFANLRFVWLGSELIGALICDNICIQRYVRFDRPPRQLPGRLAPASSSRGSASALRDGDPIAAAGSSPTLHVIASIILLALIIAAVSGGDLILKAFALLCSRDSTFQLLP